MSPTERLIRTLVDTMERPPSVEAIRQRCTDDEYAAVLAIAQELIERATVLGDTPRTGLLALTVALEFYSEAYTKLRALIGCEARRAN